MSHGHEAGERGHGHECGRTGGPGEKAGGKKEPRPDAGIRAGELRHSRPQQCARACDGWQRRIEGVALGMREIGDCALELRSPGAAAGAGF
jgi:hypothetical protein